MESTNNEIVAPEKKLTPLQKWRLKNPDYNKRYYENVTKPKLQENKPDINPEKEKKTENIKEYMKEYMKNYKYYQRKLKQEIVCDKCGCTCSSPIYLERHQRSLKCKHNSLLKFINHL